MYRRNISCRFVDRMETGTSLIDDLLPRSGISCKVE
jgi:hypothetical protein